MTYAGYSYYSTIEDEEPEQPTQRRGGRKFAWAALALVVGFAVLAAASSSRSPAYERTSSLVAGASLRGTPATAHALFESDPDECEDASDSSCSPECKQLCCGILEVPCLSDAGSVCRCGTSSEDETDIPKSLLDEPSASRGGSATDLAASPDGAADASTDWENWEECADQIVPCGEECREICCRNVGVLCFSETETHCHCVPPADTETPKRNAQRGLLRGRVRL